MITRREMNAAFCTSLIALLSGAGAALRADAAVPGQNAQQNAPSGAARRFPPLLQESIGDIGDAEASMLILNIAPKPPGGGHGPFTAHKHSGPVFAYVLEGSVENQVEPEEPKTYNVGDFWYEPAMHVHRSLRNLSDTQQARILIFQVLPKGKPPAYPVQQ